ncbi:MAG TPA: hypothetical protein VHV83_06930 [Armatimonadota bacterium]|nr:hypothetical protein [Armatimonadota bacterium]
MLLPPPEVTKTPPRKSHNASLIIIGILVIALCASWGVNAYRLQRQQKAFESQLATAEQHNADVMKQMLQAKAISLASAMQMVNADLLTENGQKNAQSLFVDMLRDPNIAYVALLDNSGNVTATTDLRLARDAGSVPANLTKVELNNQAANGADFEAVGPITDASGSPIGAVRVGITIKPTEKSK